MNSHIDSCKKYERLGSKATWTPQQIAHQTRKSAQTEQRTGADHPCLGAIPQISA